MNERVVPKMTNYRVVKLSNKPVIAQHREVPVPRRQDVDERPCVPRLELNGPALRHFESQPDSPRINQRFPKILLICQTSGQRSQSVDFETTVITPPKQVG